MSEPVLHHTAATQPDGCPFLGTNDLLVTLRHLERDTVAGPSPFDIESLLQRCPGDSGSCAILVRKFAARADDQVAALARAARAGNAVELAREAHTLKGVAANLSAEELRAAAAQLEQTARAAQFEEAGPLVDQIRELVNRCVAAVPEALGQIDQQA